MFEQTCKNIDDILHKDTWWDSELAQEKLLTLLQGKYQSLENAKAVLGEVKNITALFVEFQKHLYEGVA